MSNPSEHKVLDAANSFYSAFLAGNEEIVESLTADDYVQTDIFGHVQDKSTWMREYYQPLAARFRSGEERWDGFAREDIRVQLYGSTAVLLGKMTLGPRAHTSSLRFTQVWVERDGIWKRAITHNSIPTVRTPSD